MSRLVLLRLIKIMFGLLFVAFGYIFIIGIGGNNEPSSQTPDQQFTNVAEGQSRLLRLQGKTAWITRLSKTQRGQLRLLGKELSNPDSGCNTSVKLCVVFSQTSQSGVNLSYSEAAPPQVPSSLLWIGGFVDPTNGAVFDLLGRAYKLGLETDSQHAATAEF